MARPVGEARFSTPPKVGTPVKILVSGYLNGQTGTVSELIPTDEFSRWDQGIAKGQACRVRLHQPIATRWLNSFVTDVLCLWGWEVEPLQRLQ